MLQAGVKWILIFYSVPAKPVSNRMQIWRRLSGIGAVALKDAVYILPDRPHLVEFALKLIEDIKALKGDGFFVRVTSVECLSNDEIIRMFNSQIEQECFKLQKQAKNLQFYLSRTNLTTNSSKLAWLKEQLTRLKADVDAVSACNYFENPHLEQIQGFVHELSTELTKIFKETDTHSNIFSHQIPHVKADDFKSRLWVTRTKPFVDRIASAWLIKNFIDPDATFGFVPEGQTDLQSIFSGSNPVGFDIQGGLFSHVGDLCTFEVIQRAFAIKAKGLKKLAEIVHELDLQDGIYNHPETAGLQAMLTGLCSVQSDNLAILQKGFLLFDFLYESLK